jgi:hypothetical protein
MTGGDAQMRADIATYGWHVIKVLEDDEGPGFAFTIGLYQRFEHPELIVRQRRLSSAAADLARSRASVAMGGPWWRLDPHGAAGTCRRLRAGIGLETTER